MADARDMSPCRRTGNFAETLELLLYFETQTANAIRVSDAGRPSIWLPKSQITFDLDQPKLGMVTLRIPEWLAKSKGLI